MLSSILSRILSILSMIFSYFKRYRSKVAGYQIQKIIEVADPKVIEMPCLGRPFRLGMLYDCRSDKLIPGITLWDDQKLTSAQVDSMPKAVSSFQVISEDSFESKASHLDISSGLKLSYLGGEVNVSGSAKYLDDFESSAHLSRVSLKYSSETKVEQLTMRQLAKKNIDHPEVFENKMATHVVIEISHGADAIFVFNRKVKKDERKHEVHGKMEALIQHLPAFAEGSIDAKKKMKRDARNLECSFYGDFNLEKNPTTFEDAVKVCQDLPGRLNGKNGIPKKVWLYPLSMLNDNAAKLVHEISVGFVHQAEIITEELRDLTTRSNDILEEKACSYFLGIQTQLKRFKSMVSEYQKTFSKELSRIVPEIRGGKPESKVAELIKSKDNSPFNSVTLTQWLRDKEQEIEVLKAFVDVMQDIEFVPSQGELNAIKLKHDSVLCFSINVKSSGSDYLDKMRAHLDIQASSPSQKQPPCQALWFEDREVMASLTHKAKSFANFTNANKENDEVKFVVASSSEKESGFAIELYKRGIAREFERPSAPVIDNCHPSYFGWFIYWATFSLRWSQPECGSENVTSYTVSYMYKDRNNQSDWYSMCTDAKSAVIRQYFVRNQKYYFKVRAECELGVCEYSEVIGPV